MRVADGRRGDLHDAAHPEAGRSAIVMSGVSWRVSSNVSGRWRWSSTTTRTSAVSTSPSSGCAVDLDPDRAGERGVGHGSALPRREAPRLVGRRHEDPGAGGHAERVVDVVEGGDPAPEAGVAVLPPGDRVQAVALVDQARPPALARARGAGSGSAAPPGPPRGVIVALARIGVPSGLNSTYFAFTVLRKTWRSARIRLLPHSKPRTGGRGSCAGIDGASASSTRTGS